MARMLFLSTSLLAWSSIITVIDALPVDASRILEAHHLQINHQAAVYLLRKFLCIHLMFVISSTASYKCNVDSKSSGIS